MSWDSIGWKLAAIGSVDALVVLGAAAAACGAALDVGAVAAAGEEAVAAVVVSLTLAATEGLDWKNHMTNMKREVQNHLY